jgi:hypothetical protein
MPEISRIPEVDEISPAWLTEKLRASGFQNLTVETFQANPVGTGQAASCYRFSLKYADPDPSFPRSIIGKFPARDPQSRDAGKEHKTYLREVNFYRSLQGRLSIKAPRCYFAGIEGGGPRFALLLEDLEPARQGDQIAGCSQAIARQAVMDLVGLHAPSWSNPSILGLSWLDQGDAEAHSRFVCGIYRAGLPHFMARCGEELEAAELKLVERLATASQFPSEAPALPHYCLIHSDYRLDNLLIDETVNPPNIFPVDWQTMVVGNPTRDVAYFLGGCLLPDVRARCESDIVREYHEKLQAAGADGYDLDTCWADYRRATFHGIMNAVVAMNFVTKTERGDRLFAVMAQRHARQALELGAEQFIE